VPFHFQYSSYSEIELKKSEKRKFQHLYLFFVFLRQFAFYATLASVAKVQLLSCPSEGKAVKHSYSKHQREKSLPPFKSGGADQGKAVLYPVPQWQIYGLHTTAQFMEALLLLAGIL